MSQVETNELSELEEDDFSTEDGENHLETSDNIVCAEEFDDDMDEFDEDDFDDDFDDDFEEEEDDFDYGAETFDEDSDEKSDDDADFEDFEGE
ncbi:MAG: hypothetical protein R3C28_22605 [Pirellulaceae bacterium]